MNAWFSLSEPGCIRHGNPPSYTTSPAELCLRQRSRRLIGSSFPLQPFQLGQGDGVLGESWVAVIFHPEEMLPGRCGLILEDLVQAKKASDFGHLIVVGGRREKRLVVNL